MQESGENYLETILILDLKNGVVRSTDIANELGVTKPSVSRAMRILKTNGYITMEEGGPIHLTQSGRERACAVYERHRLITKFLTLSLGVEEEPASRDACRMEHILSDECFEQMKQYVERNT